MSLSCPKMLCCWAAFHGAMDVCHRMKTCTRNAPLAHCRQVGLQKTPSACSRDGHWSLMLSPLKWKQNKADGKLGDHTAGLGRSFNVQSVNGMKGWEQASHQSTLALNLKHCHCYTIWPCWEWKFWELSCREAASALTYRSLSANLLGFMAEISTQQILSFNHFYRKLALCESLYQRLWKKWQINVKTIYCKINSIWESKHPKASLGLKAGLELLTFLNCLPHMLLLLLLWESQPTESSVDRTSLGLNSLRQKPGSE